jgi:hypothetical protein
MLRFLLGVDDISDLIRKIRRIIRGATQEVAAMNAPSTNEVLISILQILRTQTVYLDRQHGWLIAVADTLRSVSDDVAEDLEQHAFYDQGPRQDARITQNMLETIDGLISLLRHRVQ